MEHDDPGLTPKDAQSLDAAKLYYSGLAQREVAERLHVSRSTVSKLLAHAERRGFVRIEVYDPRERDPRLLDTLIERFGLLDVRLVSPAGPGPALLRHALGREGAALLADLVRDGDRIATIGSRTIAELARQPGLGLLIRGAFVSDEDVLDEHPDLPVPVIGGVGSLQETVESSEGIAVVVAEDSGLTSAMIRRLSQSLGAEGRLIMLPPLLQIASSRLWMRSARGLSAIEIQQPRADVAHSLLKRTSDIIASSLIIVLLVPVWLIVPPLIWMQDRGPILFRQTRIGLNGKPFKIWKFRSMRINADAELAGLLREQNRTDSPLFKVDNDPRITRVGAFLRRTSIDELPQLFNVLAGSMSLVGPRPQVAKEVALYDEEAARRLLAKPGITGLWQVSGRSSLTWEEAIRLDLFYVDNWTPGLDLWILLRTVKAVLLLDGSA